MKINKYLWLALGVSFATFFIIVAYYLSSGAIRVAFDSLALALAGGLTLAVLVIVASFAWRQFSQARRDSKLAFYPDENGNYPLVMGKNGQIENANLIGSSDNPVAWSLHTATRNGSGTQPREIFQQINNERPSLPPVIQVEDEDKAPPILIEAQSVANNL